MKKTFLCAVILAIVLPVILAVMYGVRAFNAVTVQHNVISPVPGVQCVIVSTTDGASTACWKE